MNSSALESLSARRAWIEIRADSSKTAFPVVALRKESVDRNRVVANIDCNINMSLSARRAWIEICLANLE